MLVKKRLAVIPALLLLLLFSVAAPARADMPISPQALQGSWMGTNGQQTLILMFMGNNCALVLNGAQLLGNWNLVGNRLTMQFQNGNSLSYSVALQGNTLILDGNLRLMRTGGAGPNVPPQTGTGQNVFPPTSPGPVASSPLEGTWSAQIPQGTRSFRFTGNRYAQLLNGQVVEEGEFQYSPDGRFQFRVTSGLYAGQAGEDRITINGNSITVAWPDGAVVTFIRDNAGPAGPGQPAPSPDATPLEGRWTWAKKGPVTFGYIFTGKQFIALWNGMEKSRGTFTLTRMQLTLHYESGLEAGKTDVLGYQLTGNGNRLLIFASENPNMDPIPFVRQ